MSGQNSRRNATHTGQMLRLNGIGTLTHEIHPFSLSLLRERKDEAVRPNQTIHTGGVSNESRNNGE